MKNELEQHLENVANYFNQPVEDVQKHKDGQPHRVATARAFFVRTARNKGFSVFDIGACLQTQTLTVTRLHERVDDEFLDKHLERLANGETMPTLDTIVDTVCGGMNTDPVYMRGKGRDLKRCVPRMVVSKVANVFLYSTNAIARATGASAATVSNYINEDYGRWETEVKVIVSKLRKL